MNAKNFLHCPVFSLTSLLFMTFLTAQLGAQDQGIDLLRKYPYQMLEVGEIKVALQTIDWQYELLRLRVRKLNVEAQQASDEVEALQDMAENLVKRLPIETRFVDSASRSKIVSRALEELLTAKLDLAVIKEQLSAAKKLDEKRAVVRAETIELEVASAKVDLDAAKEEYVQALEELKHTQALLKKGFVTERQVKVSEAKVENQKLKIRKAEASVEITKRQAELDMSDELLDLRLKTAPIESRIKAAEGFLQKYVEANKTQSRIDLLNHQKERTLNRLNRIEGRLFELRQEMEELATLKSMVDMPKEKEKKEQDAGSDAKKS